MRRVLLHALHHYLLQAGILLADFNLALSTLIAKQPTLISPSNLPALRYYIIIHHMMIWMHKMTGLNTLHEHRLSMYPEKFSNLRVTHFGMSCVARHVKSKPFTCKVCTYIGMVKHYTICYKLTYCYIVFTRKFLLTVNVRIQAW